MKPVCYSGAVKDYVDLYDGADCDVWNSTKEPMLTVRKFIREHYLHQQGYKCAYCQIIKKESHGMVWDIEHVLPKSKYPAYLFEPENLALACKECNGPKDNVEVLKVAKKYKSFPRESDDYLIVHPHFDVHSDHFEVSEIRGKRIYRVLNCGKAKYTYIACNFFRFDCAYAEWDSFDGAVQEEFLGFLDKVPPNATVEEIRRMIGFMTFSAC